jgi:ubiquinone/menaquinone biosynthesis C-methylase UbiE
MSSKAAGLPPTFNPQQASRMYDGVEYKDFWDDPAKMRLDKLERAIVRKLLPVSGQRILDLGCGYGRLASCYLERFEQVVMLDGSITLLRQAQETIGERATYIAADANRLPFRPGSFDCVLMIRVFHHINDSQVILSEMHRIISNGGNLIFNYCNKLSVRQLLHWTLRRTRENPLTIKPTGIGTRLISHHPAQIEQLLKQHGFTRTKYLGAGILDKLPGDTERFSSLAEALTPLFGAIKLAPWINCRATLSSEGQIKTSQRLDDILVCPVCHQELTRQAFTYHCRGCEAPFPIENGILDFRIG